MAKVPATINTNEDIGLVKLAREIAINHFPIETILKTYQISDETWEEIQKNPRFQALLKQEIEDWHGALNTHERVKLKTAAMIEEYLPEGNVRLHDHNETLNSKVELLKLLARIAGMGLTNAEGAGGSGEKFSVTINLGADQKLTFEKQVTPKVIEATPSPSEG
jgi:hypothetical protein